MLMINEKTDTLGHTPARHARAFDKVLCEEFGVPFTLYDAATGMKLVLAGRPTDGDCRSLLNSPAVVELAARGQAAVTPTEDDAFRISLVLYAADRPLVVAVGVVPALASTASARATELARLQAWARDFSDRIRLRNQVSAQANVEDDLRRQLASAWMVNLSLGECMRRFHLGRQGGSDCQRLLLAARQLLNVQSLHWVPLVPGVSSLVVGDPPVTEEEARSLVRHLNDRPDARNTDPYICNAPQRTHWGAWFPKVGSLLALYIHERTCPAWLVAFNKLGKASRDLPESDPSPAPFRTRDAVVLSSFASTLQLHVRVTRKFREHRNGLVGMARSLANAVDAKYAYTIGHSERVGRLSVEIGRELHLSDQQLSETYLAGLLHDVGMVGIRDAIVCKPAPLRRDEVAHLRQHVMIGCRILVDLHWLRSLLPAVLHHHERFDGGGYPEGLVGDKIPFLARLLAVADCFDAMNSERPHRPALPRAELFAQLKCGAGTQWDPQIVNAALRCTDRLAAVGRRSRDETLRQTVDADSFREDSHIMGLASTGSRPEDVCYR